MKYLTNLDNPLDKPSVITIGNFDGLHLGHRKLISTVKELALAYHYESIVFSFYPHPHEVLKKDDFPGMIYSREEKRERIEETGIDTYIEYPFTKEFASYSPEEFVVNILIEKLHAKIIVIGSNNRFGKNQEGDVNFLKEREVKWDIKVVEISPVLDNSLIVSSSRIREELMKGNIEKVNELLTLPYIISGTIVEGRKIGRQLGYPTANLLPKKDRLYPPNGVYLTKTKYKNKIYNSITNIGYNPTVNGKNRVIETYIDDFCAMVYGEKITIEFYKWLRAEKKFSSLDELVQQLDLDVKICREYFN